MAVTTPQVSNLFEILQGQTPTSSWKSTDTTDYSSFGLSDSEVKGCFTLDSPVGIIHANSNFSSPDTDGSIPEFEFSNALPLASDGLPMEGAYGSTYTIQITKAIAGVTSGAGGSFEISGDRVDDILAVGTFTVSGSTGNDGTYTVVSASFNGTETIIVVANVPDATVDGDLSYVLPSIETEFSYNFCAPTICIEQESSCNFSVLQSKDVTNYTVSSKGNYTSLAPTSVTRVHTLKYPAGIVPPPADIVGSTAELVATPIYTNTWTTVLTPTIHYTLPSGLEIEYTVTATKEIDVTCDTNLCAISACIQNLYDSYVRNKATNWAKASEYQSQLLSVVGAWMNYSIAQTCGNEEAQEEYFAQIKAIAKATGCDCCSPDKNTSPTLIIPLGGSTGGSGTTTVVTSSGNGISITPTVVGSTITYQLTLTYSTIASNLGASQIETIAGVVNNKFVSPLRLKEWWESGLVGNSQVVVTDSSGKFIGQNIGTAHNKDFGTGVTNVPEIGATLGNNLNVVTDASGKLITQSGAFKYELLHSDISDDQNIANTTTQILKTYTLPPDTLINDGEYIKITSYYIIVDGSANSKILALTVDGVSIGIITVTATNVTKVTLEAYIYRRGATSQLALCYGLQSTANGLTTPYQFGPISAVLTLASPLVINSTSQVLSGNASIVTSRGLTVEIFRL